MKSLLYLLHGFVFALGSAIILYAAVTNLNTLIHPADVVPPTLFSILSFFLFVLVAYALTRNMEASGLIGTLLVLGFFYLWSVFLMVIVIALVSLLSIQMLFKRVRSVDAHRVLSAISVAVVGYYLVHFIGVAGGTRWMSTPALLQPVEGVPKTTLSGTQPPDIYHIILDSYGREDMLQSVHGFDNSGFIQALEQRGFVVASHSKSNYARTILSLSSTLNMQYLDTMSAVMGDSNLWWPAEDAVHHSEVRRILETLGYKTVFFATNSDYSDIRDGDVYKAAFPIQLDTFSGLFLYQTNAGLLARIDALGIADLSYDTHRQIVLHAFERLPEVAAMEGPKYVFAHIIAPHPPYVFDRAGNPVDPPYPFTLTVEEHAGYVEQLHFVNRETLNMIDGILANSDTPPIILLHGDHGPGTRTNHDSLEKSCMYERFSILSAYHLPGVDPAAVPMDLSPVNLFRFLFNEYYNTDLELLPNRQYFSTNSDFYQFIDVTGQTEQACG